MTEPQTLRHLHVQAQRLAALHEPHVHQLTEFVHKLRQRKGDDFEIPYFDPLDGGTNARALFLLEAPGPQATGSGFISRDNPDPTAANIWTMSRAAGLDRRDCLLWNVCPWYVGTPSRIRAVRSSEIREAQDALRWLIKTLPRLECVALVGRKAQKARSTVEQGRPDVQIVEMFHPSRRWANTAERRAIVASGFKSVAEIIGRCAGDTKSGGMDIAKSIL